jgi:hypothetical protein
MPHNLLTIYFSDIHIKCLWNFERATVAVAVIVERYSAQSLLPLPACRKINFNLVKM